MIYLQDLEIHLAKLKKDLEERLEHPFLVKHLPSPKIDEDKLLLLYAIFDEIDLSDELKKSYILTAMLVQIALDTHDAVTTNHNIKSDEFVQRQLTVLAGDYFSGLYYLLLSEIKDIKMVRTLAMAIKEINEHKIKLYHDHHQKLTSVMDSLQVVETSLFQHVADHFKLNSHKVFSIQFLTYKRLSHEKFQQVNGGIERSLFSLSYLSDACNVYFEKTISLLNTGFLRGPVIRDLLLDRLHSIRFHDALLHEKKTVEEGL
ncbi:MAG TPA: heptaprenyl diphosphate synthase component 1 [Metabacillus sp.]|nr:heptaprenyl diphosphate synthase component 1 [Metabacillus sp.]